MPYDINQHNHRFAAWSAARAASVKEARFDVKTGRRALEDVGLEVALCAPQQLPHHTAVDEWHREKRGAVITAFARVGIGCTHGVAAKLINVYLKARFVCGGHAAHPSVDALHPPIDELLLNTMFDLDVGGLRETTWKAARKTRWSKLNSDDYEQVVQGIRASLQGRPMWMIEEHWRGHQ
ncbi:MAG: hypothetical protein U1E03_08495 [Hyphomonadaceae bacterium]